ncbi:CHAT domain-containing protein [Amycolatopsis tolypomycina]|uniref:CHAT domain-containing protein n=1 Tax=Amycolatopsis tolypomycina TaxID=208445 RepID=UPI0033BCB0AD
MDFWQDVRELHGRIDRARGADAGSELCADDVVALAGRIDHGAAPRDPARPTQEELVRCSNASYLLGWWHYLRFEHLLIERADPGELARAVVRFARFRFPPDKVPEHLLPIIPGDRADPVSQLSVVEALIHRIQAAGDPVAIEAVVLICRSIRESEGDSAARVLATSRLGLARRLRYQHADGSGDPADLDAAVIAAEEAVAALPPGDPTRRQELGNLAVAYRLRFDFSGAWADLRRAIELGEELVGSSHAHRDDMLADLSVAYWAAYRHTGERDYLDKCADSGERALARSRPDPVLIVDLGLALVAAYFTRNDLTGDPADLVRGADIGHQVIAAAGPGWPGRANLLTQVSLKLWDLADRTGDPQDRRRAVQVTEQALQDLPSDDEARGPMLLQLHQALLTEWSWTVGDEVKDQLIETGEGALAALPADHAGRVVLHQSLARAYESRFAVRTTQSDLDSWIMHREHAVRLLPPGEAQDVEGIGLADAYYRRFPRRGDPTDLDRAIELLEPVAASDREADLVHPWSLLASIRRTRFLHTGLASDLDAALRHSDLVVDGLAETHPLRAGLLSNAATVYFTAWEHRHTPAELTRAIELFGRLLAEHGSTLNTQGRAALMSNLANALRSRAELTASVSELTTALALAREALELLPPGAPDRPAVLSLVGGIRHALFDHNDDVADLLAAVDSGDAALAACPLGEPNRPKWLSNLAYACRDLFDRAPEQLTPDRLASLVSHWSAVRAGEPAERVHAGFAIGSLAHALGDNSSAVAVLDEAVALLPTTAPLANDWTDNEPRLRNHFELAHEVVAAHLADGDPIGAVEVAEASRGVLLSSVLCESGAPSAPRFDDLRAAVEGGTGILVNVGRRRADAVLVTADGDPVVVPLPDLHHEEVGKRATALLAAVNDPRPLTGLVQRRRVVTDTFAWLWTAVAQPVLAALGPNPGRVWWIPTGMLGLFPLHAAGPATGVGCLDLVVSSYTPTIRALAHARNRPVAPVRQQLTIALANTPGQSALPGTTAEIGAAHATGEMTLVDAEATVAAVRAALPDATWVHFACHAVSNLFAPATGGLHLHDGVLTVPEIGGLRPQFAELAYLSACWTADVGPSSNEAISLSSVFHLAGFRHVVATLWPLDDTIGAEAAEAFYGKLPGGATAGEVARAVHEVTRDLRARYPERPDLWAGIVHSGA